MYVHLTLRKCKEIDKIPQMLKIYKLPIVENSKILYNVP